MGGSPIPGPGKGLQGGPGAIVQGIKGRKLGLGEATGCGMGPGIDDGLEGPPPEGVRADASGQGIRQSRGQAREATGRKLGALGVSVGGDLGTGTEAKAKAKAKGKGSHGHYPVSSTPRETLGRC